MSFFKKDLRDEKDLKPFIFPELLHQDRGDDDDAGEHEAIGLGNGVDAQDLLEVADGERSDQGEPDAAPSPPACGPSSRPSASAASTRCRSPR